MCFCVFRQVCHSVCVEVREQLKELVSSCTTWDSNSLHQTRLCNLYTLSHLPRNQEWQLQFSKGGIKTGQSKETAIKLRSSHHAWAPHPLDSFLPQRGTQERKPAFYLFGFVLLQLHPMAYVTTSAFGEKARGQKAHLGVGVSWIVSCPHFYFEGLVPKDLRIRPYLETRLLEEQLIKTGQSWRRVSPSSTIIEVLIKRNSLGNSGLESASTWFREGEESE